MYVHVKEKGVEGREGERERAHGMDQVILTLFCGPVYLHGTLCQFYLNVLSANEMGQEQGFGACLLPDRLVILCWLLSGLCFCPQP